MPLNLDPLPMDGGSWICSAIDRIQTWPFVKRCENPALGMIPLEVAATFKIDLCDQAVCEEHAKQVEAEIPDDSPLAKYITEGA